MDENTGETPPKQEDGSKSTIEGAGDPSTDSTEGSTKASTVEPMATSNTAKNVKSLSDRLQHLSVSPPRERGMEESTASAGRATTPPPGGVQPPRGGSSSASSSKPATPLNPDSGLGLPRTHSSPSLLDASPKPNSGPPPRGSTSSSRPSPRQTSPAVLRPVPIPMRLQHELTPVTRNTSEAVQFVDGHPHPHMVVSPEEQLHGEHLALPSGDDYEAGGPQHSSLQHPPLQQRRLSNNSSNNNREPPAGGAAVGPPYLPVAARTRSSGNMDAQSLAQTARQHLSQQGILGNSWDSTYSADQEDDENIVEPVQFPKQKFYSFNSRQQYKAAVEQERGAFLVEAERPPQHQQMYLSAAGLKPYQPSRNDLDVGLPREETSRIFISRKATNGSSSEEGSRSSLNAIPLGERQYSIPSIRMANHVQGSTTSYTDEEDDLFRGYDDDASLSSRGSSLYLPEEGTGGVSEPLRLGPGVSTFSSQRAIVIEDGMDRVFHEDNVPDASAVAVASPRDKDENDQAVEDDAMEEEEEPPTRRQERRKKRTKKDDKERQAYEWLRTVELRPENNVFCEAASSKFLTGGVQSSVPTAAAPLNRTDSSPATISTRPK